MEGLNMTVLQIILVASHVFTAYLFFNYGKAEGIVEGRKAVRKYYEQLNNQLVGR